MMQGTLEAASNAADWRGDVELTDPATGDQLDLTGYTIELFVCRPETPKSPLVSSVLTVTGLGTAQWDVPAATMATLCAGTYAAFVRLTDPFGGRDTLFAGQLPVIEGGP